MSYTTCLVLCLQTSLTVSVSLFMLNRHTLLMNSTAFSFLCYNILAFIQIREILHILWNLWSRQRGNKNIFCIYLNASNYTYFYNLTPVLGTGSDPPNEPSMKAAYVLHTVFSKPCTCYHLSWYSAVLHTL